MKQKCEEIIIDQYLKGNITDKQKTRHLGVIAILNKESEIFKVAYNKITKNPEEFFKTEQEQYEYCNKQFQQFVDDNDLHHLLESEQKSAFVKKVLIPIMEEIEDELPE